MENAIAMATHLTHSISAEEIAMRIWMKIVFATRGMA